MGVGPSRPSTEYEHTVGKDFPGNDIYHDPNKNWQECLDECSGLPNCHAVAIDTTNPLATKGCWLKTKAAGEDGRSNDKRETYRARKLTPKPNNYTEEFHIDRAGNDIGYYATTSWEECINNCNTDPNCKAVGLQTDNNQAGYGCWLKNGLSSPMPHGDRVTYVKKPQLNLGTLNYGDIIKIKEQYTGGYLSPGWGTCNSGCGTNVSLRPDSEYTKHEPNSNLRNWLVLGGAPGAPVLQVES
jgi:hypothetical protein